MDLSKIWMMTLKRNPERESIQDVYLMQWMIDNDIHKWIIAKEHGKEYDHYQIRMQSGYTFDELKEKFPTAHIEEGSDKWTYERKEGNYYTSWDTPEVLITRFGQLREWQKQFLDLVKTQSDRQIDVCWDPNGNQGKSFLISHLYETSRAHCIQGQNTAKGIVQDCASEFIDNGMREMVVIDIPWSWKWTNDLYIAIERIKDGLIKDTRYNSRTINIRGVKVVVMCNTKPNVGRLAADRWRITELPANEHSQRNTSECSIPLGIEE